MKHNFSKILAKAAGVLCICALFASFSPSLDGRAVVADEGVFPEGLFAKTVGYLPGDVLSVNNISGNATVDILVIGALDPSEGVAIMLSPEAAKAIGITKNSNNIVKITKRTGQDERAYGTAVIAKNSGLDEYFEEEARAAEETPVQSPAVEKPAKELTEEAPSEESEEFEEEAMDEEDFEEESFEDEEFEEETSEDEEFPEESEDESEDEDFLEEESEDEEILEESEDEDFLEEESEDEEFLEESEDDEEFEDDEEEFFEDEEPGDFEEESEEEDLSEEYEEESPEEFEDEEPEDFEEESEEEDLSEEYEEESPEEFEDDEEEFFEDEEPEDFEEESEEYAEETEDGEEAFEEESEEFEDDSDAEYEEADELEALSDETEEESETEMISDESEAYEETEEDLPAEEAEEGPEAYVDDELSALPSYNVVEPSEAEETEEPVEEGTSEDEYDAIVLVPADEYPPEVEEVVEENSFQEDMVEDLLLDTKTVPEVRANEVFEFTEEKPSEPVAVEPVREEPKNAFDKYTVGSLSELKKDSYYIQIAVLRDENNVADIITKYAKNYPVVLVPTSSGTARQVLIGPLSVDEYGTVLARFKANGFKDAFLRKIK